MKYQRAVENARRHAERLQHTGKLGRQIARSIFELLREIKDQRKRLTRALQRAKAAEQALRAHGVPYVRPKVGEQNDG